MTGRFLCEQIALVRRRSPRMALSLGILLIASTLVGCGNDGPTLVEAGGTVTYRGAPVPGATVVFVPDAGGLPVTARTDDQGRFTVATQGQPGAAVGTYKISITAVQLKGPVSVNMTDAEIAANTVELIPKTYANHRTSGLTATVSEDPSQNDYRFDLE